MPNHNQRKPTPEPGQSWGLFGGAFDPIHNGHLTLARDILTARRLAGVLFVPTARPTHRSEECRATFEDRCAMIDLAVRSNASFMLSTIEHDRGLSGYMLHTIRALKETYADVDWQLIVGADHAQSFKLWYQPEDILAEVHLVIGSRPGFTPVLDPLLSSDRVAVVATSPVDLSASEIRKQIATGIHREGLARLVPAEVADYIAEHHLYTS